MRRRTLAFTFAALALLCGIASASAEDFGTAAEARSMIQRAITALKANEADALAAFKDQGNEQFHFHDLYVFCINMPDGKFTAQFDPALIGTDVRKLKLGNDDYGQRIFATLAEAPEAVIMSVGYNALRPGTTSGPVPKVSFVARVGRQGCGVGYYR